MLDLILLYYIFVACCKCTQITVRLAESLARKASVQEAEESKEQEGPKEEPGAEETEEQEDRTEKTAEEAVPTDQSESREEQANT